MAKETTFYRQPKRDVRDRIDVEVGDSKDPDFQPQAKVMRWNNEVNVSVRLVHDEAKPTVKKVGEYVEWKGKKKKVDFYEIDEATEIDVTLYERPDGDKLDFTLNTKGVQFIYQPALTPEEIAGGAIRPDNVVGSWAVFAKEKKINLVGGTVYGTGKVGHIFNSLMMDAAGKTARTNPQIVDNGDGAGTLTINFDKAFLDNAVYPIRHAAGLTFGYTTAGASFQLIFTDSNAAGKATAADTASATSLTWYGRTGNLGNTDVKGVLWQYSDSSVVTNGVAPSITVDTTTQWWTHTYSSQPSFTPQDYYIGIVPNGQARCYYDTVTGGGNIGGSGNSYATPTTFGATGVADRQFSAYVTYTLAGAFTRNTFLRQAVNRASTY